MTIALVSSRMSGNGTGRVTSELFKALRHIAKVSCIHMDFSTRSLIELTAGSRRVLTKFQKVPFEHKYLFYYSCQGRIPKFDLYDIMTQNLSFLRLEPKVVTCLDLIHVVYPKRMFETLRGRLLYSGLKKASSIIAISEATKKDLIRIYNIPEDRIFVVYPGVNHDIFRARDNSNEVYAKYKLEESSRYVMHLSSEVPTKNTGLLIKAFHRLKKDSRFADVKLLKIGRAQYEVDRRKTLKLIENLGMQRECMFVDNVSDLDLSKLYNIAELFVFPSLYEGFGLPPLEAMACGTPVVTSNVSSLPEVVGDAGIKVDPHDVHALSEAMYKVLSDEELRKNMVKKGLERAKQFSWERTATETLQVYAKTLEL